MDVRCERCKAQYVFDDEQITPSGLAVQCTNCGHLFRVKKKELVVTVPVKPGELDFAPMPASAAAPGATASAAARSSAREWRVRRPGGAVLTCRELTTVQKWIVEGKVAREDEISAGGDSWRRLGEIEELSSFFSVVAEAERARATPVETPRPPTRVPPPPPSGFPPPALPLPPPGELTWPARASEARAAEPSARPRRRGLRAALLVALLAVAAGAGAYALVPGRMGRMVRGVLGRGPTETTIPTATATATSTPTATASATPSATPTAPSDAPATPTASAAATPAADPSAAPAGRAPEPAPPAEAAHADGRPAGSPAAPGPELSPSATPAVLAPGAAPAAVVPASAEAAPAAKPARPRGPKALLAEAGRLRARGDATGALELYGRLVSDDPENVAALTGRGLCYLDLSRYAPAAASFESALKLVPSHADALLGLAEAYRAQGRDADAIRCYERYLAEHPDGEEAAVARNAIAELRR
ncbi:MULTISPECIES: zinc-ribbon domain-containing protein [Anaeromyxobacter]|uniref:zinc-ribbon domain-containing protein n=1 Tax=Anaeromyxobacter TaxID=161492 RepID=UPI001F562534|nr:MULTISPECIES: tetratricopeptide repeat protein [unclassified Anaeromyxobacter]